MSHWEDAINAGAEALVELGGGVWDAQSEMMQQILTSDAGHVMTSADEHLHDHYLERIIEGQDDQADEALLEHYRLIVLREELERLTAGGPSLKELLYTLPYLRARVAELEGQKQ